jgi:hypothetical protein
MGISLDHEVCGDIIVLLAHDFPVVLSVCKEWCGRMLRANRNLESCRRRAEVVVDRPLLGMGVDWCRIYRTVWTSCHSYPENTVLSYYCGKIGDFATFQLLSSGSDYGTSRQALIAAMNNDQLMMVKSMVEGEYPDLNVCGDPPLLDQLVGYLDKDIEILRGRCSDEQIEDALRRNEEALHHLEHWCGGQLWGNRICWADFPDFVVDICGDDKPPYHKAVEIAARSEDVNHFRLLMELAGDDSDQDDTVDFKGLLDLAEEIVLPDTAIYREVQKMR